MIDSSGIGALTRLPPQPGHSEGALRARRKHEIHRLHVVPRPPVPTIQDERDRHSVGELYIIIGEYLYMQAVAQTYICAHFAHVSPVVGVVEGEPERRIWGRVTRCDRTHFAQRADWSWPRILVCTLHQFSRNGVAFDGSSLRCRQKGQSCDEQPQLRSVTVLHAERIAAELFEWL